LTAVLADVALAPPAYCSTPPRDGSLVRAVEGVAARIGRTLDPAQHLAVDVLTSSWADGRPASLEAAVISSRQNLKTYCLELITLTRLLRPHGDRLAVWSAHEVSTAQETFKTFLDLADLHPWLGRQVEGVSRATGRESITFKGGRRLKFKARIKTGGRGLSGDLIVLDEAFALQPEHMGSLLPILSTKAKGMVLYGSSAPHATSDILHRLMKRGRAGGVSYIEWSAPGSLRDPGCSSAQCRHEPATAGCVMDDEALWLRSNPAAVYGRISMDYLRAERLALPPEEFARERLGWGEDPVQAGGAISQLDWQACTDEASTFTGRPVFAIAVSRDGASSAIAAAGLREDGLPHVEVVAEGRGTSWVAERAGELRKHRPIAWVLDKRPPAAGLLPDLKEARVIPREMNTSDCGQACAGLQGLVGARGMRHRGDEILTAAVAGAARRDIGDGLWAWSAKSSEVDIVTLVAATNALWGLSVTPKPRPLVAFK